LLAFVLLLVSWLEDKGKTRKAVMKGLKSLIGILGDFSAILLLVGLMLTLVSPATISRIVGAQTGVVGMLIASLVGAVTLIPGFVAFPLAKSLLDKGAGVVQIAVLVSTLMMVGVVTAPLESRYFGRKETFLRNGLAYVWSFIAAVVIGLVVR